MSFKPLVLRCPISKLSVCILYHDTQSGGAITSVQVREAMKRDLRKLQSWGSLITAEQMLGSVLL